MVEQPTGTVTMLFTDIEGSTRLLDRLGDERYGEALELHRRLLRETFERHGGYEVDHEGDAFFVAFASAHAAVAAAAEAQQELARASWPDEGEIRVRMGLHTGEPRPAAPKYVGIDVHKAARIMAAGHGGQVLVSETTARLIEADGKPSVALAELGLHRLKDFERPVQLYQIGRAEFPPLRSLNRSNLPIAATPFLGRTRELADVVALLRREDVCLLTLTGPGGTGKTRLALEAASELVPAFSDGVLWISLAALRDPDLVLEQVALALGAREELGAHIGEKELLVLLDNFEQLLAGAPPLGELLTRCPKLKLLVTSREPLHLAGERRYSVEPLGLAEAAALFRERALSVRRDLHANGVVEAICLRLDCLPLAVELAAARVAALSPEQLLERLEQRLPLLTGGPRDVPERQRTLLATIEWSYDLLSPREQRLLARLSVFAGGCTLDAAEQVAEADLDTLQSLVDKSLLRFTDSRYWMLETIREYALERHARHDGGSELGRRHALHFLALAELAEAAWRDGDRAERFDDLDLEVANLRAAIGWAREHADSEMLLRLATALWRFWYARGYVAEGKAALEDALAATEERPVQALIGLCRLRFLSGAGAAELLPDAEAVLERCERQGDDLSRAQAWNLVGALTGGVLSQLASAEHAFEQALVYAQRVNNRAERAESTWGLMLAALCGPLPVPAGIARADELLRVAADEPEARAFCLSARGALAAMAGEVDLGREQLAEGTALFEHLGLNVWAANNAQLSFVVEMLGGDPEAAVKALRAGYDRLLEMEEKGFLATIAGYLAHALHAVGDDEESDRFSRASESAAAGDDFISQILWRSARAKTLARRGHMSAAEALAREAVGLAEQTDLLNAQGDALLDLADVLVCAERPREALLQVEEAARRFDRKGNVVSLERATGLAQALAGVSDAISGPAG